MTEQSPYALHAFSRNNQHYSNALPSRYNRGNNYGGRGRFVGPNRRSRFPPPRSYIQGIAGDHLHPALDPLKQSNEKLSYVGYVGVSEIDKNETIAALDPLKQSNEKLSYVGDSEIAKNETTAAYEAANEDENSDLVYSRQEMLDIRKADKSKTLEVNGNVQNEIFLASTKDDLYIQDISGDHLHPTTLEPLKQSNEKLSYVGNVDDSEIDKNETTAAYETANEDENADLVYSHQEMLDIPKADKSTAKAVLNMLSDSLDQITIILLKLKNDLNGLKESDVE